MLISYAQEAGRHGHGMDELALLHLRPHAASATIRSPAPAAPGCRSRQVPLDRATAYAAEDADVTLRLWQALRPRAAHRPARWRCTSRSSAG